MVLATSPINCGFSDPRHAGAEGGPAALNIAAPTDAFAGSHDHGDGQHTTGTGDPAATYAGPVSVELDDAGGDAIFTTSGTFSGGVYTFQLPALTTSGVSTRTIRCTSPRTL